MESIITDDFQVFIKPVGARCNLRCGYCYYVDKGEIEETTNEAMAESTSWLCRARRSSFSEGKKIGEAKHSDYSVSDCRGEPVCSPKDKSVMNDKTLEHCIWQLFSASTGDTVLFTWHGGEPMLAEIDFYQKVVSMQKRLAPHGKHFLNGIQTNGTLITKKWAAFFAENKFIVGISIDGPADFHNAMRYSKNKSGSFEKTLTGYRLLRGYGVNPEILCVVNSCNVKHPLVVYDFFKNLGAQYITFLPLVEKSNTEVTKVSESSVPSLEFGIFLSAIFDEWVKNDIGSVKIQIFEEALRTAFKQEHSLCIFRERCGGVPVIEQNGDFYPCDHFVEKDRLLGTIHKHSLEYFLEHPVQKAFGDKKSNSLPQYCIQCEVRAMCNGECPKNRFITSPDGEPGLNYLCEGYKYFFNHCKPFVEAVSVVWKK